MKRLIVATMEQMLKVLVIVVTLALASIGALVARNQGGSEVIGFLIGGALGFLASALWTGIVFVLLEMNETLKKLETQSRRPPGA
jgi:hypothetical protein